MGGYGAVKFALKYPDLFSSVAAFAGGFRSAEEMLTGANRAPREIMRRIFADDPARFRAEETRTLARSRADSVRGRLGIKLLVGSDDFLLPNNRLFKQALEEAGLAHEYTEIPGIQHDLPKLAAWLGFASLEFAVKHFGISRDASRDGPWVNPPAPAETAPAVEHHVFWSAILGRPVGYNVYLPPSYPRTNPIASSVGLPRLPVVFHLLGSGDGESTHAQHMRLLDQAIRGGEVPPAAWVWVYTGRRSWCTDHADGAVTPERMLVREFIPHFESRWDLGGSKSLRAISGWSMGGFGALKVACRYPELFASVVTYGGAFWDGDEFERRNADGWQRVFGDAAGFAANDPTTLLRERVTGLRGKFALRCIVGATDFLAPANDRLKQSLDALGYGFEYEQIPAVGHEPGAVFAHEVHRCFRFHARHFGRD
jgi:enterochelin esterase-like enzyme